MFVKYIGGRGPVYLPAVDLTVEDGESVEVPDEFGAGLLAQGSSVDAEGNPTPGTEWVLAKSPKGKAADAESQKPA